METIGEVSQIREAFDESVPGLVRLANGICFHEVFIESALEVVRAHLDTRTPETLAAATAHLSLCLRNFSVK